MPNLGPTARVSPVTSLEKGFQKQLQSPVEVLKDMFIAEAAFGKIALLRTGAEPLAHVVKVLQLKPPATQLTLC